MTDKKPAPCYRDRDNGVRFIKSQHRIDCDEDCRGCKPCPERHCTARTGCTWHVAAPDITCGRCIAGPRRDIGWIEALSALMPTQAMADGVDSQAAVLAGPAADPRGHSARRIAEKRFLYAYEHLGRITEEQHLAAIKAMDDEDWQHAYSVLTRYQMMFSEDYGHDLPNRLSIAGAAGYLGRQLHRIAQDPEQDFAELAGNLRKCRQHLEAVLHNDTKPDRGALCPTCVQSLKAKRADLQAQGVPEDEWPKSRAARLTREYAHHCDDEMCERFHFLDDASDVWRCPREREHWWTQKGYADDVLRERQETA